MQHTRRIASLVMWRVVAVVVLLAVVIAREVSEGSVLGNDSAIRSGPKWQFGAASLQGRRSHMEDTYRVLLPLSGDLQALVGVFDGHGSHKVAELLRERLLPTIVDAYAEEKLHDEGLANARTPEDRLQAILPRIALQLDQQVLTDPRVSGGSTAVVAIVTKTHVVSANVGDSRGVLCRPRTSDDASDGAAAVVALSVDHKPNRPDEKARIELAGGRVTKRQNDVWRLQGRLAMSRAFGDKQLKAEEVGLNASPEIRVVPWQRLQQQFLILASDGLWDVTSNEQAARLAMDLLVKSSGENRAQEAASGLANGAYDRGSTDNITVVVMMLDPAAEA